MRLRKLPVGRAWEALREDEIACRSLGINTTNTKLTAFAIGAMFGGFAGSFFAVRQGFVSPESFNFLESAIILAIVVLGGMGSQIGVAIAAVALVGGPELLRNLEFLQRDLRRGLRPERVPPAPLRPRHEFIPPFEDEFQCHVGSLLHSAISGGRVHDDVRPLADRELEGLVGWTMHRG